MLSEAIKLDQQNIDAKFYKALSLLDSGQNQDAIDGLKDIIKTGTSINHAPVCHILLSIAYKRLNDFPASLSALSDCIELYPAYPDAYLARG